MTDTALGTSAALAATETLESPARRAWRRLVRHKGAMLGLAVIAIFILLVLDPLTTLPSAAWVIGAYAMFAGFVLIGLGLKLRRA